MVTQNERQSQEFTAMSKAEMSKIEGGAWYAKFDGVDGSAQHAGGGGGGAGKVSMHDIHVTVGTYR